MPQAIRVEVPGLGIVEFPAGTPADVMQAAVRKRLDLPPMPKKELVDLAEGLTRGRTFDMSGDAMLDPAAGAIGAKFTNQGLVPGTGSRPERGARVVLPLAAGAMTGGMSIPVQSAIEGAAFGLGNKADDGDFLLPAVGAALGGAATRGLIKGGGAVLRIARQPSKAVAARAAQLAEREAAEATSRAKWQAGVDRTAAADDLKLQTVQAKNAAEEIAHNRAQAEAMRVAREEHAAAQRMHDAKELARVDRETKAFNAAQARTADQARAAAETEARLKAMKPVPIVTDRVPRDVVPGRTPPALPSGWSVPPDLAEARPAAVQPTQFLKPSATAREVDDLGKRMMALRRAGLAPPSSAGSGGLTLPQEPTPALPFRDFVSPPQQPFTPAPLPSRTPIEAYTPTQYPELPPVTGLKTRGGEMAVDALRYGLPGGAVLAALYKLWR